MPTYIVRVPQDINRVKLERGDVVPEGTYFGEPDSYVALGRWLKLDATQAKALKALKEKRDKAYADYLAADAAWEDKLDDLEAKADGR